MYTEVKDIVSLGLYRDGRSLSVTYVDPEHTKHVMIFRNDSEATEGGDGAGIYTSARVESYITADWLNPITCVSSSNKVVRKTPVTWEKAAEILGKLRPLAVNLTPDNTWILHSMEQVASSELQAVEHA